MGSSLLLLMGLLAAAQATHATVAGVVRDDASGEPLAGAVVALTDLDRAVTTDGLGRYRFTGIPAGPQHVAVRRIGYAPRTLHALVPTRGALEVDIALRREPRRLRPVEVRPTIEIRGLDDTDSTTFPDRSISLAGIRNHPMLSEPDVLLALGGGEIVMHPELPSGVHLRGGASDQTAYAIDGVPVLNPFHAAGTFSAWNPDAIERVRVSSAMPGPEPAGVLAGVVAAETRAPGARARAAASLSSSQARLTVDGPVGDGGGGFLVGVRTSFPGAIMPAEEPSYLHGAAGDALAKLEMPLARGRMRMLVYASENALDVASEEAAAGRTVARNEFAWRSRSAGAEWRREIGDVAFRVRGWGALGDANALWYGHDDISTRLVVHRHDVGILAGVERRGAGVTFAAVSIQQSGTRYATRRSDADDEWSLRALTPSLSGVVRHQHPLGIHLMADASLTATAAAGGVFMHPAARLRWSLVPEVVLSGSIDRTYQFAQSLRNTESIVGVMFPADLFVGANAPGIPVARSDRIVLAVDVRPGPGLRLGAQAYWRAFDDVLLVAPNTGEPFAAGAFTIGAGTAHGIALDAVVSGTRYGLVGSYGWQDVRLHDAEVSYTPEFAARHHLEAGAIWHPVATASIRAGVTGVLGRRATAISGVLEWETCNLLDWGCEFGGSPHHVHDRLGRARLPGYFRLDLGVRKHWHVRMAGRDAEVAIFGAVTNLLGRRNVLAIAAEPLSGELAELGMRPLAPLVVGLDWRF